MVDTPKKKRGNPNFKRGVRNPYSDKVKAKRWAGGDKPKELVGNEPKLVENEPVEPAKAPDVPPDPTPELPPAA